MGAFFTNVQVQVIGGKLATTRDAVLAAVRDTADAMSMVELTGDQQGTVVRSVVVVSDRRWITVYDQATEAQDGNGLLNLGCAISRRTGGAAVSVGVYDSDLLELGFYRAGAPVDHFCSDPDYFAQASPEVRRAARGQPEQWSALLGSAYDPNSLAKLWKQSSLSAEERLRRLGKMIGLSPERLAVGFNSLKSVPFKQALRLVFGTRAELACPSAGAKPPLADLSSHAPALQLSNSFAGLRDQLTVGEPLLLAFFADSVGGPGRGVTLWAWGSALTSDLIVFSRVKVSVKRGDDWVEREAPLLADPASPEPRWMATFEELEVPMGSPERATCQGFHVKLEGNGRRAGVGGLQVGLAPSQNPEGIAVALQAPYFEVIGAF